MIRPGAETWVESHINSKGPLAGIPVSLKDSVVVGGFDVSVGYSRNAGKPCEQDGAMVRMLKDAGQNSESSEDAVLMLSYRCRAICEDQPTDLTSFLRIS